MAGQNDQFTEVALDELHHVPVGRTLGKIKEHLTDIYRVFLRNGTLDLLFNGEGLSYEEPRTTKDASCSSADQGGGKRCSGNSALV